MDVGGPGNFPKRYFSFERRQDRARDSNEVVNGEQHDDRFFAIHCANDADFFVGLEDKFYVGDVLGGHFEIKFLHGNSTRR